MRFYNIAIESNDGQIVRPPGFATVGLPGTYTSKTTGGQNIPGAWNVELDIPVGPAATPLGGGFVRVWGVSVAEIGQANDLINKKIKIFGGMQKGLPLANPAQAGLLAQGYIFQAFGNWVGTEMTLDLIVQPGDPPTEQTGGGGQTAGGTGMYDRPVNLVINWKKQTAMGDAIKQALSTAFPGFEINVNVSDRLISSADQIGVYPTLTQFSQWTRQFSRSVIRDQNYLGVEIAILGRSINVYDGTAESTTQAKQIEFVDLIGQPTWIEAPLIQLKCVMRADIGIGDTITLPQTAVINTAQALSSLVPNQRLTFQGEFLVVQQRHLGNFRQPDANSWVTVINAAPKQLGGQTGGG